MNEDQYFRAQDALFEALSDGTLESTVVPYRDSYVNAANCLTIVHLISTELATLIVQNVLRKLSSYAGPHYWYPLQDLHITIKNIRKATPSRVYTDDELRRARSAIERSTPKPPLTFQIHGPICLPTSIVLRAYGSLNNRDMVRRLDEELKNAGIPDDKVYASNEAPIWNITLCRFTEPPSAALKLAVEECKGLSLGDLVVSTAQLVQCDEVCSTESRMVHATMVFGQVFPHEGA